jgi:hypothetical protein
MNLLNDAPGEPGIPVLFDMLHPDAQQSIFEQMQGRYPMRQSGDLPSKKSTTEFTFLKQEIHLFSL